MRGIVKLVLLVSLARGGDSPFPLLPFMDFFTHATAARHLQHFRSVSALEQEYFSLLVEAGTGGYIILPLDEAKGWTESELADDRELRRQFLLSRFARPELLPKAVLSDGQTGLRLAAINAKYVYVARPESAGSLCLTPQTFRPVKPQILQCARVVTTRVFADIQAIFTDGLLFERLSAA